MTQLETYHIRALCNVAGYGVMGDVDSIYSKFMVKSKITNELILAPDFIKSNEFAIALINFMTIELHKENKLLQIWPYIKNGDSTNTVVWNVRKTNNFGNNDTDLCDHDSSFADSVTQAALKLDKVKKHIEFCKNELDWSYHMHLLYPDDPEMW